MSSFILSRAGASVTTLSHSSCFRFIVGQVPDEVCATFGAAAGAGAGLGAAAGLGGTAAAGVAAGEGAGEGAAAPGAKDGGEAGVGVPVVAAFRSAAFAFLAARLEVGCGEAATAARSSCLAFVSGACWCAAGACGAWQYPQVSLWGGFIQDEPAATTCLPSFLTAATQRPTWQGQWRPEGDVVARDCCACWLPSRCHCQPHGIPKTEGTRTLARGTRGGEGKPEKTTERCTG